MKQFKYSFLFLMILLSACSEPQSFEFKGLQDIQLDKLTMGKNKIRANVKYYNPNPFSLVLKQIDCKVLLNNGNFTVL
jgi:LEA14-like dessication related protein